MTEIAFPSCLLRKREPKQGMKQLWEEQGRLQAGIRLHRKGMPKAKACADWPGRDAETRKATASRGT